MMKFNFNNMQNFDFDKSMNFLFFLSFVTQWSMLSMIINLFTLGILGIPIFLLMIIDAITMIKLNNKTLKRPSLILSKLWDVIDYVSGNRKSDSYNSRYNGYSQKHIGNISQKIRSITKKVENFINDIRKDKLNRKKYDTERELNRFSPEIGKKITIEYASEDNKIKKKSFEYKDRATTYIKVLESKGYRDYTKYNLDPQNSLSYIVFNKNKDIVNVFENRIHVSHEDNDYKFITEGWPKK